MALSNDADLKHVFSIQLAWFNSVDEFAKSITDTLKNARHPILDPQSSISVQQKTNSLQKRISKCIIQQMFGS